MSRLTTSRVRRATPRRTRDRRVALLLRGGVLLAVLVVWYLAGDDSRRMSFPTPVRVAERWWGLMREGGLGQALLNSNVALVLGYGLALLGGLALGVAMASLPAFGRIARPYLTVVIAVPMIAMLPLIQVLFGIELTARVVVVFLFAFVYIALNTELGARSVPPQLTEMARSLDANRGQRLFTVTLPHAVPAIAAGARLALGRAIAGMVLAELFLVSNGIGSLLAYERSRYDAGAVFAICITLVLEGVVLMTIARQIERRLSPAAAAR